MKGRVVLVLSFFIQATIVFEAGAADTTIKGTGATSATAGLEVTNSADTSLLYVRNDGNVGIGTTAPNEKLHVRPAANDNLVISSGDAIVAGRSGVLLRSYDDNSSGQRMTFEAWQYYFDRAGSTKFYIHNDGNVGIGIATPATALEVYKSGTSNTVDDILTISKEAASEPSAGIGAGVVFKIVDAGGIEEQASIDVVLTDVTDTTEDADIIFSQNVNGTMTETMRLVANTLSVALDSISSYDSAAIDITLGSDAGDDLIVDTTGLVYEGDNNRVGIGTAAPDTTLDLSGTLSYTPSATQSITGVGSAILANAALVVLDPDGNYTLTSTPTIADGAVGQIVYITAAETEANGIAVQDENTLTDSNLQLGAASRAIAAKDVLVLMFNGVSWVEVSYANN